MIKLGLIGQQEIAQSLKNNNLFEVVFECNDGRAQHLIENNEVDLVICDLIMDGVDGFTLLEQYPDVKFVVASTLKSEVFILKALDLGAMEYIVKPVDDAVLEFRLQKCMQLKTGTTKHVRTKSFAEKTLDERLANIFISVGIPAHIKGYQFLREGIKLAVDNPGIINCITKGLYPAIALRYKTTASKVERAIRHAIEVAWARGKIENLNSLFGVKVYSANDKPTNGEFIALLCDKMLLEMVD
ncbi:MAG: response regulator [Clostridia bacterium]|nr:response regulator [Clostridia bacterium]